jgi:hypothetical protein
MPGRRSTAKNHNYASERIKAPGSSGAATSEATRGPLHIAGN